MPCQRTSFPTTFDGSLPSEKLGAERIQIGQTYFFENAGNGGVVGTVTAATVNETERQVYLGVTTTEGKAIIVKGPMSEAAFDRCAVRHRAYLAERAAAAEIAASRKRFA